MLIQVVHSHPLTDSYNHALFRTIVETLQLRHDVIATDLYRDEFAPAMTETERRSYYAGAYAEEAVVRLVGQSPAYPMQFLLDVYAFPGEDGAAPPGPWPKELVVESLRSWRPVA